MPVVGNVLRCRRRRRNASALVKLSSAGRGVRRSGPQQARCRRALDGNSAYRNRRPLRSSAPAPLPASCKNVIYCLVAGRLQGCDIIEDVRVVICTSLRHESGGSRMRK
jgi:hypothetical protein